MDYLTHTFRVGDRVITHGWGGGYKAHGVLKEKEAIPNMWYVRLDGPINGRTEVLRYENSLEHE